MATSGSPTEDDGPWTINAFACRGPFYVRGAYFEADDLADHPVALRQHVELTGAVLVKAGSTRPRPHTAAAPGQRLAPRAARTETLSRKSRGWGSRSGESAPPYSASDTKRTPSTQRGSFGASVRSFEVAEIRCMVECCTSCPVVP